MLTICLSLIGFYRTIIRYGLPKTSFCPTIISCGLSITGYYPAVIPCSLTITSCGRTIIGCGLTITSCGRTIIDCGLTITSCGRAINDCGQCQFNCERCQISSEITVSYCKTLLLHPRSYHCSDQHLYTACQHGWSNCQKYISKFQQFSSRYKPSFINGQLQQVSIALNLPGYQARNAQSETNHILLIQQATSCLRLWQKLKRYIASAYPSSMLKQILQQAGSTHYRKASRKYWNEMEALLTTAGNFITNNKTQLIASQNMPPAFQTTFNTEKLKFQNLHNQFLKSEESGITATAQKIMANNSIHAALMSMLLDAQYVFTGNQILQQQFTFQDILRLITSIKK